MRILVTGGAGYIGSTLVQELLSSGHKVTVLDSLLWGNRGLDKAVEHAGFRFVKGDIRDAQLVQSLVADQEVVVHLAALVGNGLCENSQNEAKKVNVAGSQVIAGSLRDEQLLIYASTGSVYGQSVGEACTEQTQPNPKGQYALTKLEAEKMCLSRRNTVVFRFATVFGASPRQRLDLLVNQFVYEAVSKGALLVMGKDYPRSTVHIRDTAGAIKFAIDNHQVMSGQIFNVSSSEVVTKEQIAEHIRAQVSCDLQYANPSAYSGSGDYFLSTKKLEKAGYHSNVSLDQGIGELVAAVKDLKVDKTCFNYPMGGNRSDRSN
jgi:nucleoside-diphosphate-sugar epimerase